MTKVRLPERLRTLLAPYYPGLDLRRVSLVFGIPQKIRRLTAGKNPLSISVGYRVYLAPKALQDSDTLLKVLLHELRHCQQYAKFGKIMYRNYLVQVRKHGYWDTRIERDARLHEARVRRDLARRGLLPLIYGEIERIVKVQRGSHDA